MTDFPAQAAGPVDAPSFLSGGGEMGARMRSHDWSRSPLGDPHGWPPSLRSVVSLMLSSKFPMFIAWGPQLGFLYNDAYAPIFGVKHPHALGRPFAEIWSEIWGDIRPLVDRALAGEASYHEDLPLIMLRKGFEEQTYFTFSYSPVRDDAGHVAGLFCACTETTRKVVAERHLAAESDRLRELFRQAPGFMAVLRGPDHVFDLANEAYLELVGRRDLIGRPVREALPEVEGQGFFELLDRVYTTGEPFVGEGLMVKVRRAPAAALEDRFITFVYQPVRDADGAVAGVFAEGYDVTEAKRAEAELRRLNQTLEQRVNERTAEREAALAQLAHVQKMETVGQLTGGVAHDFNNLLQAMGGALAMIQRRTREPSVQPFIEAGQQAVDRGTKLVRQLMGFARQESLQPEAIDIPRRIANMAELLDRALRADIRLVTRFADGLWPIEVDPTQFELALINLAVNARDAMPTGGTLVVEAANVHLPEGHASGLAGDYVRLSVTDTGLGMPPEVAEHAFEPFYTTKEVGKGSGLGLAQVYGLSRQAGGTAMIDSTPGRGTSIVMLLRRCDRVPAPDTSVAGAVPAVRRQAAVLLVEDDRVVATTVAAALEEVGYTVPWVGTADEALSRLAGGEQFDLLFSDIVMPGRLSGIDLARAARRLQPSIAVVLTSGYSEQLAQAERETVLRKPYRIEDLVRTLDEALARRADQQQDD
ncbi:hybrid sensor histidine kinase/response regulator [Caenispirillum bisanense]|uniref:hybrid sensor histidine kinase/response regulator n=1 Tax=Caenispirillum bisanense TaxID=414052 RepID=UPI0031D3C687